MINRKILNIIGLLSFCQQISGNEPLTPSSFQYYSTDYNTIQQHYDAPTIPISSANDVWSPITNSPSTEPITRLHLVNTTVNDENDVATIFDMMCSDDINIDNYKIETYNGDIIVSIILHQSDNATNTVQYIVERINEIGLLAHNISLGVRILHVMKAGNLSEILENELDYLEHCTENPFGIFLSRQLWQHVTSSDKNYELKLWPLPDIERLKMQIAVQLLRELPLSDEMRNASVDLKTDSVNRTNDLQDILKSESLCLRSFPAEDNIFIYVGNENYFESVRFATNQSLIIVPLMSGNFNVSEIPVGSFLLQEPEINIYGRKFSTYPSIFISITATFLEVSKSINRAIQKLYNATSPDIKINLTKCEICSDLEVFGDISYHDPQRMLNILQLNDLKGQMNYNLYQKSSSHDLTKIAAANYVTNGTKIFVQEQSNKISLGSLFKCIAKPKPLNSSHFDGNNHENAFYPNEVYPLVTSNAEIDIDEDFNEIYWELKSELWVAIGLTMSTLGILLSMAILTFIIIRICLDDVLEGNPIGSVVMLIALIAQFTSFFPFTIEYVSSDLIENDEVMNSMCIIKIFLVSVCYCLTFSLLLSRAIMLASIGSEGGFLSHVNGYIQSIICFFSFIVQLGLSVQLLIMMHANSKNVTCMNIYNGNWFWAVIGYDAFILIMLVALSPFIFKSQRNYHEGVLIVITSILCVICWAAWIPLSMIDDYFREIMIALGVQMTGWIILGTLMVPRCFLIVKSIARSDFTQALPSLTSLAFAQANHFISEPSIYECVNPTMRTRSIGGESDQTNLPNESYQSPSEVPTLPLRGGRRNLIEHYNLNFNEIVNPNLPSPNKMTRF